MEPTAHEIVFDEILRLKALASSIEAMALRDKEIDHCELEELAKMVKEYTEKLQDKLVEMERKKA